MDLSTNYCGLRLKNPLIAGASPLSREVSTVRELEDAGVAAVVMYSLFEEQINHAAEEHEHFESFGAESFAEATSYAPSSLKPPRGPEDYLEHVGRVKRAVDIPVFASLNGHTVGGWIDYARLLEQAGADGIELNVYHLATDPEVSAAEIEQRYIDVFVAVRNSVSVPIALKLSPYFSSLAHFAHRLDERGVDGLVLFNRFYQPDIDLDALDVQPNLVFSAHHEMRLPLRWVAILDPLVEASLAASTGVTSAADVIKLIMAGADAAQLCAVLLRRGVKAVSDILRDLNVWMYDREYESVHQMQGCLNHRSCPDPAAFERANYMKALHTFV